jgi:hypothetical protein
MTRKLCSRVSFEDATERERFRLVTEAALMYCKMLRENSMLGFPGVLSLHSRSTTEADRLGVIMESLRQGFERKLGELCRSSQWPEFDRRFGIALKKWAESDSHLFYDVRGVVVAFALLDMIGDGWILAGFAEEFSG